MNTQETIEEKMMEEIEEVINVSFIMLDSVGRGIEEVKDWLKQKLQEVRQDEREKMREKVEKLQPQHLDNCGFMFARKINFDSCTCGLVEMAKEDSTMSGFSRALHEVLTLLQAQNSNQVEDKGIAYEHTETN